MWQKPDCLERATRNPDRHSCSGGTFAAALPCAVCGDRSPEPNWEPPGVSRLPSFQRPPPFPLALVFVPSPGRPPLRPSARGLAYQRCPGIHFPPAGASPAPSSLPGFRLCLVGRSALPHCPVFSDQWQHRVPHVPAPSSRNRGPEESPPAIPLPWPSSSSPKPSPCLSSVSQSEWLAPGKAISPSPFSGLLAVLCRLLAGCWHHARRSRDVLSCSKASAPSVTVMGGRALENLGEAASAPSKGGGTLACCTLTGMLPLAP
eukprot:CAMPEP_0177625764 /NCGR_PEP_ID=MMETSP0419_2-20121207/30282_1 /TAXON_ID=582737 /ORGANISM="Tetraselmis sp., Strain GSL018" /LENGTH=260 /DNA_ID=CAMNT_0019126749 /DNA_START=463 /DNA_END=1242 /DNA_ORIENTATION=-